MEEHCEKEFFEEHIQEIIDKSKNLRKMTSKIDRQEVKNMYMGGIKQNDIARHFKCLKSTVSEIIKELNINKEYKIDYDEVEKLYNNGLRPMDISRKLNIKKNSIYSAINRIKNK